MLSCLRRGYIHPGASSPGCSRGCCYSLSYGIIAQWPCGLAGFWMHFDRKKNPVGAAAEPAWIELGSCGSSNDHVCL